MMLSRADISDSFSSFCCSLPPGRRSMDLIGLDVRKLALRSHGQRAKRDGNDGENGNPGTYDADAHDRTLSGWQGHEARRAMQSAPCKHVMAPPLSYKISSHAW